MVGEEKKEWMRGRKGVTPTSHSPCHYCSLLVYPPLSFVHLLGWSVIPSGEDAPLVEFLYLVFTRMPGDSYRRRLRSLLCLCDVFGALINSPMCSPLSEEIIYLLLLCFR